MNVLVIGETGQLSRALQIEGRATCGTITCLGRQVIDLCSSEAIIADGLRPYLSQHDVIIIAAAYTAVDAAEDDYQTAYAANAIGPGIVSKIAAENEMPVVYISTDYVFPGTANTPYKASDLINPINAYGRSKAAGEKQVLTMNTTSAVLRTSWLYDGVGKNFLTTILRLGQAKDQLSVVADQIGRPTYTIDLALASLRVAEVLLETGKDNAGIFHVSNTGAPISWAEFAQSIFDLAATKHNLGVTIKGITSSEYPTRAKRPNYSVLNVSEFEHQFGMSLPHWSDGLKRAMQEYYTAKN